MSKDGLKKAVSLAGGQSALVSKLKDLNPDKYEKMRQGHIWKWLNKSLSPVPPDYCVLDIEQVLDGEIQRHELRPDLYPIEESAA